MSPPGSWEWAVRCTKATGCGPFTPDAARLALIRFAAQPREAGEVYEWDTFRLRDLYRARLIACVSCAGKTASPSTPALPVFTDYILRTLIYLALRPDRLVVIAEIAEAYGISNNHLMKVVHRLALSGDVVTARDHRGGLRLARPANEIIIGTVACRCEADLDLVPCFGSLGDCAIKPACMLAGAVDEALRAFLAVLDSYTLADLVRPRMGLARLLRIDEPEEASSG